MSCPTCDHTMQTVFADRERIIRHCPRCGTMRSEFTLAAHLGINRVDDTVPKLVERCREYQASLHSPDEGWTAAWRRIGIAEAINVPADRPK